MNKNNIMTYRTLIFFAFCNIALSFAQKPISKSELLDLYNKYYLSSNLNDMPWKGDVATCNAGTLPDSIYKKVQDRVNFFRLVNRLPEIKVNMEKNKMTQEAAFMMLANNALNHFPPKTWKCYTELGFRAATQSCLGLISFRYFKGSAFLTHFILDNGESNYYCGHRRWILYSKSKEMSYGSTGQSEALLVVDGVNYRDTLKTVNFTAYPWSGHVPHDLIFYKWSFSIPEGNKVDYSNAKLEIKCDGKDLGFKLLEEKKGLLDPTITWKMTSMFNENEESYGINRLKEQGYINKEIKITLKNVMVNDKKKDFGYSVIIDDLSKP